MKNTFFKGCYVELSKAQATKSRRDFDRLGEKILPSVRAYANWMTTKYPISVVDTDDYVSEALLAAWKALEKYRYICPECGDEYLMSQPYAAHCKESHGKVLRVKCTLESYMNSGIKIYMRNLMLRHVNASKRSSWNTVYIEDTSSISFEDHGSSPDDITETNQRISRIKKMVGKESNRRIAFFMAACLMGMEKADIYNGMVKFKLNGCHDSAKVAISKLRRTGMFERYKSALTG